MAERTEGTTEIDATPEEVMDVITDFEAYPEWADGIRVAKVERRDEQGRPAEVSFEFSAMGFEASYTLVYDYAPDHGGVSWTTKQASGAVRDIEGEYVLKPEDGDTTVTYRLTVDIAVPLPGFLKRRADKQAIRTALEGLKKRVEA